MMDEKYVQLLETLASKLGTTAEHLWGVLVRQAPISGATNSERNGLARADFPEEK